MEERKATLELLKRLFVTNKEGEIVFDSGLQPSHSFVLQFLEAFYAMCSATAYAVTTIGNVETAWPGAEVISLNGAAANVYEGIVVGTGTVAEASSDIAMGALIANGVGAGQLQYGLQGFTQPAIAGANVDFVMTRTFINGSGSTITVTEIGIHEQDSTHDTATTSRLAIRDVLASGVAVADAATLTVQYTLRTTV